MLMPSSPTGQRGYSLMELLIALTIGVILFAWMSDYLAKALADHTLTLQRNLLAQEFHAVQGLMDRDLRRAGFWNNAAAAIAHGAVNPFTVAPQRIALGNMNGEAANSCITYSYDLNLDNLVNTTVADEHFGFRLHQGSVEMRTSGSSPFDCNSGTWTSLTTPAVAIDALSFGMTSSYCYNLSRSGADCNTSAAVTGDQLLRTYLVNVSMNGHVQQNRAIQRSDTFSVRVRNMTLETK